MLADHLGPVRIAGDLASGPALQLVDPSAALGLAGPARGAVAFVVVLLVGAALHWRRPAFLERSVAASMDRPLAALGYGAAAHAVIVFAGAYLANQLSQIDAIGADAGVVGAVVGGVLLLLAAALGFTVFGAVVADLGAVESRWPGAVLGAVLAGGAAAVQPLLGAIVWFVVVSTGIGGPVREWFHASEGPDRAGPPGQH